MFFKKRSEESVQPAAAPIAAAPREAERESGRCANHINVIRDVNDVVLSMMKMDFVKDMIRSVEKQMEMVEVIAAASEESAASITEISGFVRDSALSAATVAELTAAGLKDARLAVEQIGRSAEETETVKRRILDVSDKTREIDSMVSIIKSVADQTNLLALNASIEAARAGEAGRGFAVVADEIKKLADSTKVSVETITQNVSALRGEIISSVSAVEKASETFASGRTAILRLADEVSSIDESVGRIRTNMETVSGNIDEQSAAAEEIASNLSLINENTKALHGQCDQTGKGIYELSVAFDAVRKKLLTGSDDISDRDAVSLCIVDHLNWRWRIYNMILGYDRIDSSMVGNHTTCRLGRWVSSRWKDEPKLKGFIDRLETPHKRLHDLALTAVNAYNAGRLTEAEQSLEEMDSVSKSIVALLNEMRQKAF